MHSRTVRVRVNMGSSSHLPLWACVLALVPALRTAAAECADTFLISAAPGLNPQGTIVNKDNESPSLSACIASCNSIAVCKGFYYEDTTCLLFSSPITYSSDSDGQEGGGTLGEKFCVKGCQQPWAAELFRSAELPVSSPLVLPASSRQECIQLCVSNTHFPCRAANFYKEREECALSSMDRFAVSEEMQLRSEATDVEYIESNCDRPMRGLCHFTEVLGRSLTSPDSIYEQVPNLQTCRDLCINSTEFHCRSYDYNQGICRLSHNTRFLPELRNAANVGTDSGSSYHLTSCYNVSVHCGTNSMTAKIKSNKLFRGKVYDKSRPNSCVSDVNSDTDFQLEMGFNDLGCEVSQESSGKFSSNIIIQHHDMIVTEQDLGLSIKCSYSLSNRSVQHGVNLDVRGEPAMMGSHESSFVLSPTVTMHITDRNGDDIHAAQVGDPLSLRFRIIDQNTPYEIFVRELIAFDGVDSSEILLIDSNGCPTDPTIMGAINSVTKEGESQVLEAPFDAFKFPTSDVVQFKALVTPCLPTCEPVSCTMEDYFGTSKDVASFGRRKREISTNVEEEVVMQSIKIHDKFKFTQKATEIKVRSDGQPAPAICTSSGSLAFLFSLVVSAQFVFFLVCYTISQRWRRSCDQDKF